jgi:1,4-alpha-glucan branching enzyme
MRNVQGSDDPSKNIPEAWSLLQAMTTVGREANPHALLIAEDLQYNDYITKPVSEGGAGFMSQWEPEYPQELRNLLRPIDDANRNLDALVHALNHRYNGDAFGHVIYSDSHDTTGNGQPRLNEDIAPGGGNSVFARQRSLLAASVILTAPGLPMLFEGQEFMQGGSFNDWQALDWTKAEQFKGITLAHKHLIALRKNQYNHTRGLVGQSFAILHHHNDDKILVYHRWDQGGTGDDVVVVLNFANTLRDNYTIHFPRPGKWILRFNSDWQGYSPDFANTETNDVMVEKDAAQLRIGPYSAVIFSQDAS